MKRLSTAFAEYELEVRQAPAIDCHDMHVKTFAMDGFLRAAQEFGVGPFEMATLAEWYWRTAPTWPAKATQPEFDRYARARVSDKVGYSRKRADAFSMVDRLFDKARFNGVTLTEILDAVSVLTKHEEMPWPVIENGSTSLVGVTKRSDNPKILKVDSEFLPVLKQLYPWERVDDTIVKHIPSGETSTREFPLIRFAWWLQHPNTTLAEMTTAVTFRSADRLDWTSTNLYSQWREKAQQFQSAVPAEVPENRDSHGDVRLGPSEYVGMSEGLSEGLALGHDLPARSTKVATVKNWLLEKARK